ncbi:hypothetical protein NLI96_g11772 [Meripilus lineatus]|uniref:F-box domain-containing protein n=1 Tax=Meripilus lineatus TaxID=2056292 RepID=A0AAD5Y8U4_9APHY|nr:hypothetical protein NLI96_g11772 [Physisporinus lineatus]
MATHISSLDSPVRVLREFVPTLTFSFLGRRQKSTPRLPLEIYEVIIDFVGYPQHNQWPLTEPRLEKRDLCSCVFVCRDWVPKSRVRLYEFVVLNKRRATGFMKTVTALPFLGNHTRRLIVHASKQHDDSSWIYKVHQNLPHLLPNLTHLSYFDMPSVHPLFFVLSKRFHFITHLDMNTLTGWSLREITRFLGGFTRLQKLKISINTHDMIVPSNLYCRITHGQPTEGAISTELVLDVGRPGERIINTLSDWFRRSQFSYSFDTLRICMSDPLRTTEDLDNFVAHISDTVKDLKLTLAWNSSCNLDPSSMWVPSLAECNQLQRLEVVLSHLRSEGVGTMEWQFLEFLLRCLPASLRTIRLIFDDQSSAVFAADRGNFWKAFDSELSSPKFPHLTSVVLGWQEQETRPKRLASTPSKLVKKGVFNQFIPGIFKRDILFCHRRSSYRTPTLSFGPLFFLGSIVHPTFFESLIPIHPPPRLKSQSRSGIISQVSPSLC